MKPDLHCLPAPEPIRWSGRLAELVAAPAHLAKLLRILTALDRSTNPEAMDLPGYRLHQLRGTTPWWSRPIGG
ncbi:MAG: hypothetical protein OXF33_05165 [Rhodospirillales bacterium]|nr:hypothetical protein [Rhodospirillales bacterium]